VIEHIHQLLSAAHESTLEVSMGQGSSQQQRAATPEPESSADEQAQARAEVRESRIAQVNLADIKEMRAKQQAALDKRLASRQKKPTPAAEVAAQPTSTAKKPSALEQMSKENLGWRNADAQADLRRWD
jgi:hypothetical protein|tara:strand:- start:5975 stop:6361 length:387 start_codon:yes stop_codon:yes gene_type:complete